MDTYLEAKQFCSNCTFVHRTGSGVETWHCGGHDIEPHAAPDANEGTIEQVEKTDAPADEALRDTSEFPGSPLAGRRLVECFVGDPLAGGGRLSSSWGRAGGSAERRDILISSSHDFLRDGSFWKGKEKSPGMPINSALHALPFPSRTRRRRSRVLRTRTVIPKIHRSPWATSWPS